MTTNVWRQQRFEDGVAALHSLGTPQTIERTIRWCVPECSALVLGSAQNSSIVNADRAEALGVEIVRRRSGGGVVLLEPNDVVWCDVFVPSSDGLWHDDVGRAFWWIGDTWKSALQNLGVLGAQVHTGALQKTELSRLVCFGGIGPGEVVDANRRKIVGIAQRRTREGALFQCAVPLAFRSRRVLEALETGESAEAWAGELDRNAGAVRGPSAAEIEAAFMAALPS